MVMMNLHMKEKKANYQSTTPRCMEKPSAQLMTSQATRRKKHRKVTTATTEEWKVTVTAGDGGNSARLDMNRDDGMTVGCCGEMVGAERKKR